MELQQEVKIQFEKNPSLKVLFFFDASLSYIEQASAWNDDEIICITVNGQYFALKYRIEYELKNNKVFLYFSMPIPDDCALENFPLADLLFANKQLHVDPVNSFIEEYHLPSSHSKLIEKYYNSDLRHRNRREYLASILSPMSFTPAALLKGLLCYHLKLKKVSDYNIVTAQLFCLALNKDEFNDSLEKISKLDLTDLLIKNLSEIFGDISMALNANSVKDLVCRLKYNLMVRTIPSILPEDQYSKLKEDNPMLLNRLNSLYHDWESDTQTGADFFRVLNELGKDVKEEKIIEWYGFDNTFGFYTNALKQSVLMECLKIAESQPQKVKYAIKTWFENQIDNPEFQPLIQFLWHTSSLHEILNQYSSFVFDKPAEYINRYEQQLYLVDYHYRKANDSNSEYQKQTPVIDIDKIVKRLHECYETNFVNPFNFQWLQCLKSFSYRLNDIPVSKQYNFFKEKVQAKQQRTAVIISDGFRFEAAKELVEYLSKDSKNITRLDFMLASLPSETSLGMTNLLPNNEIKISGNAFTINGIITEGSLNRSKILKLANPRSEAIDFTEILEFDQEKGRDFIKQLDVIYIYHNKIDARGEKPKTEKSVYNAVNETLDDIQVMIRKLNAWNVYRILITADHGFIHSMRDVPATMKDEMPVYKDDFFTSNRCVVAAEIKDAACLMNLSEISNVKENLKVAVPRSVNRYKLSGAGDQYVHGGASIQELLVPVIEYARMREETSEKVKIHLIKADDKISSGYLRLNVLQIDPIGSALKEAEILFALYNDNGDLVSKEIKTLFNFTSIVPSERSIEVILTLSATGTRLSSCILKAFDVDDEQKLNPVFTKRILIQTIIQKDEF